MNCSLRGDKDISKDIFFFSLYYNNKESRLKYKLYLKKYTNYNNNTTKNK